MFLIEIVFWIASFLVVFSYVLYKPFLRLLRKVISRPNDLEYYLVNDDLPTVTFVISVYNEEAVIHKKLENAIQIAYPKDKLKIVVVSDASDDKTEEIVETFADGHSNIQLLRLEGRKGKTSGINLVMDLVESDLVVFSDANAMYREDAIYELVKYFKDVKVGYVVGAALYNKDSDPNLAYESENTYWDSELEIKQLESDVYSVVGGDGAIYAIRPSLFQTLDEDDINDFANPLHIIAAGYKGIFNYKAICFEDSAEDFAKEYKRKRRIVNRSFRAFLKYITKFSIRDHYLFLILLFSHKVLRWISGYLIVIALLAGLYLSFENVSWIYPLSTFGIVFSMLMAYLGKILVTKSTCPKPLFLLYYFYLINIAAMLGIIDNYRGKRHVTWDHVRKV
jgi:cellulose synthase/poly-beta-1,6-N-acetylglucosamine synthase-like glycosyltransferase